MHQRKRKGGEKVHQKIISGREVHEKNEKWKKGAPKEKRKWRKSAPKRKGKVETKCA